MKNWILAFRPKTLSAAVVPIMGATALALAKGFHLSYQLVIFALLSALFIQIGTNLINDAMDFKKGADTKDRLGPKRITVSGDATFKKVMLGGTLFFVLSILFGIPLVLSGGLPIVFIGVASIICGYAYTSGPYPLAYRGMGEIFVILFFGLIAVMGMFYLLTHQWNSDVLVLGIQIGFLSAVLIAINNLRDINTDRLANKNTLAVRFGEKFAKFEIIFFLLGAFVLNIYWFMTPQFYAGLFPLFLIPKAFKLAGKIQTEPPSPIYNEFLAQAAALQLLFGALLVFGFLSQ